MILRIVLIATAPPAALAVDAALRRLGYDVVAIVSLRVAPGRFGTYEPASVLRAAPGGDVLFIASPATLVPLLGVYAPDVVVCCSFPARIPEAALAVPRYGIVNVHPGLVPPYPGPNPLGWALRNGDRELGLTVHSMTADVDGGPVLAQDAVPIADDDDSDAIMAKLGTLLPALLPVALQRLVAGDAGDPQPTDRGYAGVFEPEYIEVDWSLSAREIHRRTRAWSLAPPIDGRRGPCTELDGHRVRLVCSAWTPAPAACRFNAVTGPSGSSRPSPPSPPRAAPERPPPWPARAAGTARGSGRPRPGCRRSGSRRHGRPR